MELLIVTTMLMVNPREHFEHFNLIMLNSSDENRKVCITNLYYKVNDSHCELERKRFPGTREELGPKSPKRVWFV